MPVAVVFWLSLKKAPCVSIPVVAFTPELPIMLGNFPNITGSFTIQIDDGKEEHTGVFNEVSKSNSQGYNRTGSVPGWDKFNFDANANKSIYKDNTNTVQPAANHVLIIIKT